MGVSDARLLKNYEWGSYIRIKQKVMQDATMPLGLLIMTMDNTSNTRISIDAYVCVRWRMQALVQCDTL